MLKTNDLILLLTEMQDRGVSNTSTYIRSLFGKNEIPTGVLKFINDNRQFDVARFYEELRDKYNHKKSTLYKNLVKEEYNEPTDVLTTLASLNLQILLFSRKLKNAQMFLSHSRAEEITRVLNNYYRTYDLQPCLTLVKLIKADLKIFESIK